MANEQQQSDWQNNKEMNIKENSSATDEGTSVTEENQEQSWREPQAEDAGEGGQSQSGFGEGGQGQSASAGAGQGQPAATGASQGEAGQHGTQQSSGDTARTPGQAEETENFQREGSE